MGFRFRKSIGFKGFRLNFSKSGVGYSYGVPGFRRTKMANGRERQTISIPGTGLSYVKDVGNKKGKKNKQDKNVIDSIFDDRKPSFVTNEEIMEYLKNTKFITKENLISKFNLTLESAKNILNSLKEKEVLETSDGIIYKLVDSNKIERKEKDEILNKNDIMIPIGYDKKNLISKNINEIPNLLIGGSILTGKTTFVNSVLSSLLKNEKTSNIKLLIADSKAIDYSVYSGLENLIEDIITDGKKLNTALDSLKNMINRRYLLLRENDVRNYNDYSDKSQMPPVILVIDDYTDFKRDYNINDNLEYITSKGYNVGVYTIVVCSNPNAEVMSGSLKSMFVGRISFKTMTSNNSVTIIDSSGAEKLKEYELLFKSKDNEVLKLKSIYLKYDKIKDIIDKLPKKKVGDSYKEQDDNDNDHDPLYEDVLHFAIKRGDISASLIQRYYKIGYNRASKIIDKLEEEGIVGPQKGTMPRDVLAGDNDEIYY